MPDPRHKITPTDVVYILQSEASDHELAKRLNVSRQSISNIRAGRAYAKVAPQLPRRVQAPVYKRHGETCLDCPFWDGHGCQFRFPEPLKDLRFAQECSMYQIEKEWGARGAPYDMDQLNSLFDDDDD